MIIKIVYKYIIVSIVMSLVFGATVLTSKMIKRKFKESIINPYLFQMLSLILFVAIWPFFKAKIQIFNFSNLLNWENILLLIMAVVPASLIAYYGHRVKPTYQFKLIDFLNGASMEIPQRLLTQNLFVILGINMMVYRSVSLVVLLNAIIFVQFIMVQELIGGRKLTSKILPELIASFLFSIFVGILYEKTGNILMPMLAHGLQRMLTYNIRKRLAKPSAISR